MAEQALTRIRVPHPHVRVDATVLAGSPHVVGSRVPVRRLWAWHRGGTSVETLVKRYPNLGPARILDAARRSAREGRVVTLEEPA